MFYADITVIVEQCICVYFASRNKSHKYNKEKKHKIIKKYQKACDRRFSQNVQGICKMCNQEKSAEYIINLG